MLYKPYVTYEYYCGVYRGMIILMSEPDEALRQASRHIGSLAYNRIVGRGFSDLMTFQQDIIQEVICQQADLGCESADEVNAILSNYSLNGASVQFGSSWNIYTDKGVVMKRDVYALLSQTDLCCQSAR